VTTASDVSYNTDEMVSLPLEFYQQLLQNRCLPLAYFPADESGITIAQAQVLAAEKIFSHLPPAPARILLVGPGTEMFLSLLAARAYTVDNITKATDVLAGLLADEAEQFLPAEAHVYNAIVLISASRICQQLGKAIGKISALLAPGACVLLCEEVRYSGTAYACLSVIDARELEQELAACGYYQSSHEVWTANTAPVYARLIAAMRNQSSSLLELFNAESVAALMKISGSWQQLLAEYNKGNIGCEFWVLHPGNISVRKYQPNDEHAILAAFNAAFHVQRSLAHWRWKYLDNPFGQTWISAAWDQDTLVAQYAAYPIPLYMDGKVELVCQVADIFTARSHRRVGHGNTNLMSRTFYHYEQQYCERIIPMGYGFNTRNIQKLGKLFWQHKVIAPVNQYKLARENLLRPGPFAWLQKLRGYKVVRTTQAAEWADQLFERVKGQYGWLLVRSETYLNWRYAKHPDFVHDFFVVYHRNKVVGWIVGRQKNSQWLWGDALFDPAHVETALPLVLHKLMAAYPHLTEVDSWFSDVPAWWNAVVVKQGFIKQRQWQLLDLIAKFYTSNIDTETYGKHVYFTWGDSDLF
jgi:hypothetical protein